MNGRGYRNQAERVALCGILLALMLVLGLVESMIPLGAWFGIPGIKLGLSNGVLIFAVYMLNIPTAWALMALKVVLSSSLYAGFGAFPYALAGGVLSLLAMTALSRVKGLHPVTVSMVGGVMHNVGQVGMAILVMRTASLLYYMGVLMLVGLATGALTGICAHQVMKYMRHIRVSEHAEVLQQNPAAYQDEYAAAEKLRAGLESPAEDMADFDPQRREQERRASDE